jgi:hypothetical protein
MVVLNRQLIISLTPGKDDAIARAQRQANETVKTHGVWEHVGLYGGVHGDIPARHVFKTQPFDKPDPPDVWALIAAVDPEPK